MSLCFLQMLSFMRAQYTLFQQGFNILDEIDPYMKNLAAQVRLTVTNLKSQVTEPLGHILTLFTQSLCFILIMSMFIFYSTNGQSYVLVEFAGGCVGCFAK